MSELDEKLNSILSNPAMMQQIMSIAQSLNQSTGEKSQQAAQQTTPPVQQSTDSFSDHALNPNLLSKVAGIMQRGSIDKNQEAVALTAENRRKFGCDNIDIIEGDAAEKAAGLPAPDCVFIGGSSGELEEIIHIALTKNSNLRLTINSVSLETLSESIRIFDKFGIEAEITQIAVTRTRKIGGHTMMAAENPVFIIKRKLK